MSEAAHSKLTKKNGSTASAATVEALMAAGAVIAPMVDVLTTAAPDE